MNCSKEIIIRYKQEKKERAKQERQETRRKAQLIALDILKLVFGGITTTILFWFFATVILLAQ